MCVCVKVTESTARGTVNLWLTKFSSAVDLRKLTKKTCEWVLLSFLFKHRKVHMSAVAPLSVRQFSIGVCFQTANHLHLLGSVHVWRHVSHSCHYENYRNAIRTLISRKCPSVHLERKAHVTAQFRCTLSHLFVRTSDSKSFCDRWRILCSLKIACLAQSNLRTVC